MDHASAVVAVVGVVNRTRRQANPGVAEHRRVVAAVRRSVLWQQRGDCAAQLQEQQEGEQEPGDGLKVPLHATYSNGQGALAYWAG